MRKYLLLVPLLLAFAQSVFSGEAVDDPKKVKRIPAPGVPLKPEDRGALEKDTAALGQEIDALKESLKDKPQLLELLPDVQIYYNAVHYAMKYDEFFSEKTLAKDIASAKTLLAQGHERATALQAGEAPWNSKTGAIVRGYVSKIDGSVQPYGLVVPVTYDPKAPVFRLDIWYHGRGEDLSEMKFIAGRQGSLGEFAPPNAFVLHPYGRYCNANKFAGEVDTFEALDNVKKHYKIDENRISVRGFSMGGASVWQFATHFPSLWCAAAPGAGFSETPEFTHAFDPRSGPKPTEFEQKLWHIYDATHYAENLFNLQTVAYSGELDGQKQAADMMEKALKEVGIELRHIIGPGTKHAYEPKAKIEVSRIVDEYAAHGRNPVPKHVKFVTYTLRYNQDFWITIDALGEHWKKARVEGKIEGESIDMKTENVTQLTLNFVPGYSPFQVGVKPKLKVDGNEIEMSPVKADHSQVAHLYKAGDKWEDLDAKPVQFPSIMKRHGLQGPIDDAFMDSFIFVAPTGTPLNAKTGAWVQDEMEHAIDHWRRTFRGEARVKKDTEITDDDIKNANLVLWGDASSNKILARVLKNLPIQWNEKEVTLGGQAYAAGNHIPILIYPNPLNPSRYVVLNSGFTFRENEYLNNAKQNAKLPDWAIIDITEPPTSRWPGVVVKADFFDELWQVKK